MTSLIGEALALILLGVNVRPSTAVVGKAQERLDREGGLSFLSEALLRMAPGTTTSAVIHGQPPGWHSTDRNEGRRSSVTPTVALLAFIRL